MAIRTGVFRAVFETAIAAVEEQESVFTQDQPAVGALVNVYAVGLSHGGQYGA